MTKAQDLMSYIASLPVDKPIALLATSTDDQGFYYGTPGQQAHELPAANILHNVAANTKENSNKRFDKMNLFLNYIPSDLELGMAWRASIRNVYYVKSRDPLKIGQYKIDVDGFRDHAPVNLSVTNLTPEENQAIEKSESRLTTAVNYSERPVSQATIEALGRGLNLNLDDFVQQNVNIQKMDQIKVDEHFMRIVVSLVDRGWNSKDKTTKPADRVAGNNIGAIMVDRNKKIIGWGLNLKSENGTFHAETLMIQKYLKENKTDKLPDGVTIYTSLECCHMCSGHITSLGKDINVIYAQKDPYFNGENTLSQGRNGCLQYATTLPYPQIFANAMEDKELILDFLFSQKSRDIFSHGYKQAALLIELMEEVQERMKHEELYMDAEVLHSPIEVSPILEYGEKFLESLGSYTPASLSLDPSFFRSRSRSPSPEPSEISASSKLSRPHSAPIVAHYSLESISEDSSKKSEDEKISKRHSKKKK